MICSICKNPIRPDEPVTICESCNYEFHHDCWNENQGCGTPGCMNLPRQENKEMEDLNKPSPWEIEKKICPVCAEQIPVNSDQCPYCKQCFSTSSPMTADDFKKEQYTTSHELRWKKEAIAIFAGSLFGITAPLILLLGGFWFYRKREGLKAESPALYFLTIAGLIISASYCLILIIGIMV